MATNSEFVQYVTDQLAGAGDITYRKMFGEYGMYCDGKIFALICDNALFIKITEAGRQLAPDLDMAPPYDGAKPYFLIHDIDNKDFLTRLVIETCKSLPVQSRKKHLKSKKD